MRVNAKVRLGSHVHRTWVARGKIGGDVAGIPFRRSGRAFIAEGLTPDQVERARNNRFIDIEVMGRDVPPPAKKAAEPTQNVDPSNTDENKSSSNDGASELDALLNLNEPPKRKMGRPRKQ